MSAGQTLMRLPSLRSLVGRQFLFFIICLFFTALAFRHILALPCRFLITHPEAGFQPTTIVALPEGIKREALIREWQDKFPKAKILMVDYPDHWPQQAGLRPPGRKMLDYLLNKYGINPDGITHVEPDGEGGWHPLRAVRTWLDAPENEAQKLVLLVDYTRLLYYQNGARSLFTQKQRRRIRFDTSVPPDAQPDTWWKSRNGWKDLATGWLMGTFAFLGGEGETPGAFHPADVHGKPHWVPDPGEVHLP